MSFENWYFKSIQEAQARYKKEESDKEATERIKKRNEQIENDLHDANYGSINPIEDEWWGI